MKYTKAEMEAKRSEIQTKWFDEWNETGKKPEWDYQEMKDEIYREWLMSMEVGDHAHICHYSDISPCTIIKKTATTLTVRHDKVTKTDKFDPHWEIGGFSAICTNNNDQDDWWNIEEDENGRVEVFRFRKSSNKYMNKCGERLSPEWMYRYDFNF